MNATPRLHPLPSLEAWQSVAASRGTLVLLCAGILLSCACRRIEPSGPRPGEPEPPAQAIATDGGIEMVLVPAGEFSMGSASGDDDEKPVHSVRLSAFYVDVVEVTQESYERLMGKNPSRFVGPDRPVDQVSWLDAARYCNMRSLREGRTACYNPQTLECDFEADGYRLPTEAEWEYACRAGTTTRWSFGDDPRAIDPFAWVKENADQTSHPVRRKKPNGWGLYDMHGNLAEWCHDYYAETYGPEHEGHDPRGPASGEMRVVRGGCWDLSADRARSAARGSESPGFVDVCFKREAYGFRCVRRAEATEP